MMIQRCINPGIRYSRQIKAFGQVWPERSFRPIALALFSLLVLSLPLKGQSLADYQSIAANENPGLQTYFLAFEAQLEKIPQVKALADPKVSLGYFVSPVETRVGPQQLRLSLSQQFPWFGSLKAKADRVTFEAEAKFQTYLLERLKLNAVVAETYYNLYELKKWLDLENENIEILASYKTLATTKFRNAQGSLVDALRVDLLLKTAEANRTVLRVQYQTQLARFNTLLNQNQEVKVNLPDSLFLPEMPVVDLPEDSHPLLERVEFQLQANQSVQVLAKKKGLPTFGFGLDYIAVGRRTDLGPASTLPENGKDILVPMATVSVPLFRASYKAAQAEAELNRDVLMYEKFSLENQLAYELRENELELGKQATLIRLYLDQMFQSKQILSLLLSAYGNSGKNFEEVLRIQQDLLNYRKKHTTALKNYFTQAEKRNYLLAKSL